MADFTAKDVQRLRQETGAGMMDAKRALTENDGDFEQAKQWLREKGLGKANERSDRENAQGAVAVVVDGSVGAAGSTGRGEANLFNLSSHSIVENMRRGMHPKDAAMEALRRVRANTAEKRLQTARGMPRFNVNYYVVNHKGEYAGVASVCGEAASGAALDRSLSALTVACGMVGREVLALRDESLAREYLARCTSVGDRALELDRVGDNSMEAVAAEL